MNAQAGELLRAVRVAPSILASDFGRLREQVGEVMAAGARVIHVDVMDGHFVPPITVGPLIVAALSDAVHEAGGMLDVHLMIERPERQVSEFIKAGAHSITVHSEATPQLVYAVNLIRESGACAPGINGMFVHLRNVRASRTISYRFLAKCGQLTARGLYSPAS